MDSLDYYNFVSSFAKDVRGFKLTVGNPGTKPDPSLFDTMDVLIIHEDIGFPASYSSELMTRDKGKWAILPYNVTCADLSSVAEAKIHVGYIYATDDNLIGPCTGIPSPGTCEEIEMDEMMCPGRSPWDTIAGSKSTTTCPGFLKTLFDNVMGP